MPSVTACPQVLLKLDGTPRLSDLGLAKHIADAKTFTVCGTPGYLAPEVVGSSGHDYAVDWWSPPQRDFF